MKLTITLHYDTRWGEDVRLVFDTVNNVDLASAHPMQTDGKGHWFVTLEGDFKPSDPYTFVVVENDAVQRTEWRHHMLPDTLHGHVCVNDRWHERSSLAPFYSSAFTKAIFAHDVHSYKPKGNASVCVCCEAPTLRKNQVLALCGDRASLGAWNPDHALLMEPHGTEWQLWLDKEELGEQSEFKFIILEKTTDKAQPSALQLAYWEPGENRTLYVDPYSDVTLRVLRTYSLRDPQEHWRGAGVAIPVFSLRSEQSFGIGEFSDIPLMVDWAAKTGQCFLQLLPVNDTTMNRNWHESYPYNAISCFALNPAYIRLEEVGTLSDKEAMKQFRTRQRELNQLPQVDYDAVIAAKWDYLHRIFAQEGERTLASASFKLFYEDNASWLRPYAAFCYLRDKYGTPDYTQWGDDSVYNADHEEAVGPIYLYIQYHLHLQLKRAADYAHRHGVVLKGDIPIGISRTSVEAWCHPGLFCLESQAGAPPDAFARDGQNWGFPTYNWRAMAEERYHWFAQRFTKMADYFDAYRIDHLLGFFRIWEIPGYTKSGLLGHFNPAMPLTVEEINAAGMNFYKERYAMPFSPDDETDVLFVEDPYQAGCYHPRINGFDTESFKALPENERRAFYALHDNFYYHRHNDFWHAEAMKKLPALVDSTDMLVCGEDLGMIPACVPAVMDELRILSLEIQRMPKGYGCSVDNPANYPYYAVCTTSTHDMSGIRGWWTEDPSLTQYYWTELLRQRGKAPADCEAWACECIVRQHLDSPAMLTILPLQDWMAIDEHLRSADYESERINVPANPHHYWRYRMHLTLEELLKADDFNRTVSRLVAQSGR
ncbi:MAG: 4-alpha-glucanotransferase [Bacteroidaceae bacterium]|nr:4-alpha-glucanotransferase [Bacteroidaceae bacterium]